MKHYETLKERATEFMLQRGWKRLTAKHREFEQSLFEHTMVDNAVLGRGWYGIEKGT